MFSDARKMCGIAVIILVAATACSDPGEAPEEIAEPPIGAIPVITSVADVTLPMDAFTQTPEQRALDYQATDLLVARCVQRSGGTFTGNADTRAADLSLLTEQTNAARFGLVDPAVAARYGYHPAPAPAAGGKGDGGASKECVKEAKTTLGKDAPPAEEFQLSFDLESDARARMLADSRYQAMTGKWSACMQRSGFAYPTPEAAADDPAWQGGSPAAAELRAAAADVTCKTEVNYLGTAVTLMTAYEQQLMEQHAAELQRLRTYYEQRSRTVLDLLNG